MFLIGLIVPAFAAWYFAGDSTPGIVRALATIGGAALGAAVMCGWGLLKLPAVMEAEAKAEQERQAAQFETEQWRAQRRAVHPADHKTDHRPAEFAVVAGRRP